MESFKCCFTDIYRRRSIFFQDDGTEHEQSADIHRLQIEVIKEIVITWSSLREITTCRSNAGGQIDLCVFQMETKQVGRIRRDSSINLPNPYEKLGEMRLISPSFETNVIN